MGGRVNRALARLRPLLAWRPHIDVRDVIVFGGLAMIGSGIAALSPPAAWIVCGLMLFWLGVRRTP
mgnify:CR=1 FL=1